MEPRDVVTSKPVLVVLAAAAGLIAGVQLDSPVKARPSAVDFYVHTIRMVKRAQADDFKLSAYATGRFTLEDGGMASRDFGEQSCPNADVALLEKAAVALTTDCKTEVDAWPHVIEIRGNGEDGGYNADIYMSRTFEEDAGFQLLPDGGVGAHLVLSVTQDLGLTPCHSGVADIFEVVGKEAFRCSEGVLDQP